MKRFNTLGKKLIFILISAGTLMFSQVAMAESLLPVSFDKVDINDNFWLERMKKQKQVLVPVSIERTKYARGNILRAGKIMRGEKSPKPYDIVFDTSDLYKVIEGAAYLLKIERDTDLEKQIDKIIELIAYGMEDDGYLYPPITGGTYQIPRYSNVLHGHELYNYGHMYEAAVAYFLATGKDSLLKLAEKNANHVNEVFFKGGNPKYNGSKPVNQAPGHQEIELGLVKLYSLTGKKLYLDMAKRFLDIRGVTYKPNGINPKTGKPMNIFRPEYSQQHLPVREQTEAVGHCVRAAYMYSAMADVGSRTGDETFKPALEKIWRDIVRTRMHITGGIGAVGDIEGFGPRYVLPNATAYDETCAAVGNVFFNYRMFLLEADAKYVDVAEVALYNNVLAGVSLGSDKFFYANALESYGDKSRSNWFGCACCPTNLARTIPQVSGMMYARSADTVYCGFYASNETEIKLDSGTVKFEQKTEYPFDGGIKIKVYPKNGNSEFALKLRIPTWVGTEFVPEKLYEYAKQSKPRKWSVSVNGVSLGYVKVEKGFVEIKRKWQSGDTVKLDLPMPVRFCKASDAVKDDIGRVALTRGPLVFCAEGIDNPAPANLLAVEKFDVPTSFSIAKSGILTGHPTIKIDGKYLDKNGKIVNDKLSFIPYYAWNNRGISSMNIWIADNDTTLAGLDARRAYGGEKPIESVTASTSKSDVFRRTASLNSIVEPRSSADIGEGGWASATHDKNPNVVYKFSKKIKLGEIAVYWAESKNNGIALPKSWNAEYLDDNGVWCKFPVYLTDSYSVLKDQFNAVHAASDKLEAVSVRINVIPQENMSIGILRIKISE